MSNSRPVKLAVIGPGSMGNQHLALIDDHPAAQIACVVGTDTDSLANAHATYGCPVFETFESAIAETQMDGLFICTPNEHHEHFARLAIQNEIPLLIEKPVAADLDAARRILDAAHRTEVPILVGHHRMYNPLLQAARDFLQSAEFGDMVSVMGSAQFVKPPDYFVEKPWRGSEKGGPLLINFIHEAGLLRFFCGEIAEVHAFSTPSTRPSGIEQTVSINLKFQTGAVGTFLVSDSAVSTKSWEMTTGENPAFPHFIDNCYYFSGTMGCLNFPVLNGHAFTSGQVPSWLKRPEPIELTHPKDEPLKRQLDHFIDLIRGIGAPAVPLSEGYKNLSVVEAIKASLKSGQPQPVQP